MTWSTLEPFWRSTESSSAREARPPAGGAGARAWDPDESPHEIQLKPQFRVVLGPETSKLTLKSQSTLTLARFDPCPLSSTLPLLATGRTLT